LNLTWLIAIIEPDLLIEFNRRDGIKLRPEAQLAGAICGRLFRSPLDDPIGDTSVKAVYDIFRGDTGALDVLIEDLSTAESRSDPARLTALTLIACVFLAQTDNVPRCLELLGSALDTVKPGESSSELCRALLLQQRALRRNDLGEAADFDLGEVRQLLRGIHSVPSLGLILRADAEISPESALQNVLDALSNAAVGYDFDVAGYPESGQVLDDLESDQLYQHREWLRNAYETKLRHLTPVAFERDLYFETFRVEILGHRAVYKLRKQLALMRIVRLVPALPSAAGSDCMRLLRQAGADSELRLLVDDLTFAGPIGSLLAEGRRIATYRTSDKAYRTGEMIVLTAAAEMMSPSEAFEALTRVLSVIRGGGPTTAPLIWQADFSKDEEAWVAAAALGGASGTTGLVARELLSYSTPERLADIASNTAIARTIGRIEWGALEDDLRESWRQVALDRSQEYAESPVADALREVLGPGRDVPFEQGNVTLNGLAGRINSYLQTRQPIPADLFDIARATALSALSRVASEASAGTFVTRAVQPAEMLAVLICQSPDDEAWDGLLKFFANPVITRSDKSRAFDILARERPRLAVDERSRYATGLLSLIAPPDRSIPDDPGEGFLDGAALRFAYAYGLLADDVAADYLFRLLSSNNVARRQEAGRSLSLFASISLGDWMLPLVYRLSGDAEPRVRVGVALALGRMCQREDAAGIMARERLIELLEADGVFVPLHTLAQMSSRTVAVVPQVDRVVRKLRNSHPSRRVRERAAALIG
jgi:hypothetical protein